jgi:hypothetical protein
LNVEYEWMGKGAPGGLGLPRRAEAEVAEAPGHSVKIGARLPNSREVGCINQHLGAVSNSPPPPSPW